MVKALRITLGIMGVGAFSLLIFLNITTFTETTNRFKEIFDINSLKNFFEIYNANYHLIFEESVGQIQNGIDNVIENIGATTNQTFSETIINLLETFLTFSLNFLLYFCNYGLNVLLVLYLACHETIQGTNLRIEKSPAASLYIRFSMFVDKILGKLKNALLWLFLKLKTYKRQITLAIMLVLLANGTLYKILVESIILVITYILKVIDLETHLFILEIFKSAFIFLFPKITSLPTFLNVFLLLTFIFLIAIRKAEYRLFKNHERLKKFAREDLTQTTFINGPPGTGKTLLNVSLTVASEENFINELEEKLLDYELKYKYLNFAEVRKYPELFPEHQDYINVYNFLETRKTYIISNYAIYSPLFQAFSKIFNFEYMRVNKPTEYYPLEEYIIISISEFDKEYNSHDNKKEVGEDGAATFFSTVSHDLKRHAKIFVDYQLKDQVPLRIRGNSEYFITIKKRTKKYPLILGLYYLPFRILDKIVRYYLKTYETKKKTISRNSNRKGKATYKRNDLTLIYLILRKLGYTLSKIKLFFDNYYYFKLDTLISQEGDDTKGKKKVLAINIRDLSFNKHSLYDSTFLSYAYMQKKNLEFKDLETFTSLTPSIEELNKCNSRFYNKINQ